MPKDKVIAYFVKAKNGPLHSNSNTNSRGQTSHSGPEDRKVLVDVGDRCVAPAKSKPKKRKKLKTAGQGGPGGYDGGGGGASDGVCIELSPIETTEAVRFVWSDDVYTVRHLAKEFDGRLPVIVKVDQGHYREGAVDLARGQVLLVSSYGRQRRVLARNSSNALLSLPLDYQMHVSIQETQEALWLSEAVSKARNLPFSVTVVSIDESADTTYGNLTDERLTVIAAKDTVFLMANTIIKGWADQSEIVVIPELLQVEFSVAQGLLGGTEDEWKDYHGMFSRSVRHLHFDSVPGYQGILREGADGNEFRASTVLPSPSPTEPQSDPKEEGNARRPKHAYVNVHLANASETRVPVIRTETSLKDDDDGHIDRPADDRKNDRSSVNHSLRPPPPDETILRCSSGTLDSKRPQALRDRADVDEGGELTDEVFGECQDQQSPTSSPEMDSARIDSVINQMDKLIDGSSPPADDREGNANGRRHVINKDERSIQDPSLNTTSVKFLCDERLLANERRTENEPRTTNQWKPTPVPPPTAPLSSQSNNGGVLEIASRLNHQAKRDNSGASPQSNAHRETTTEAKASHPTNSTQTNHNRPKALEETGNCVDQKINRISRVQSSSAAVDSARLESGPSRPIPPPHSVQQRPAGPHRGVIPPPATPAAQTRPGAPPIRPPLPPSPSKAVAARTSTVSDVVIKTSADVPTDLESLGVDGVAQCLRLLDLEKYVTEFERSGVDGRRLTDMTEKVLEGQFRFSPLEASKIVRFIRGWRP